MREVLACALVAAALAGCGGDDEPDDPGPPRTEYVSRANAICAQEGEEIDLTLEFVNRKDPNPLDVLPALEQLVPVLERQLERLRELEKPRDAEDEIDRVHAAMQKAVADTKRAVDESALDEKAAMRFLKDPAAFEQAAVAARELGLHECTKVPGES